MVNGGNAMMGSGEAEGENRAIEAAELALSNPLLGDLSIGVLYLSNNNDTLNYMRLF